MPTPLPTSVSARRVPSRRGACLAMAVALAVGVGLAAAAQALRGDVHEGRPLVELWALKRSWRGVADVVVLGDSRVVYGIVPEVLEDGGIGRRVHNFGFFGLGWTEAYLDAGRAVLDDAAPRRGLLLGITMRSFTDLAVARSSFEDPDEGAFAPEWPDGLGALERAVDHLVEPIPLRVLRAGLEGGADAARTVLRVRDDGWVGIDQHPRRPATAPDQYASRIGQWRFAPEALEALATRIARWRADGIEVVLLDMPTSPAMRRIERRLTGYDPEAIRRRLLAVDPGVRWLAPGDRFATYDGGHLPEDEARRLSTWLVAAWAGSGPGR